MNIPNIRIIMPNKTLYVKDEDVAIWDKARDLAGESLSQLIIGQLKTIVMEREAEAQGYGRIVLSFRESGDMPMAKAFTGRWLISPEKPFDNGEVYWDDRFYQHDFFAVALTPKNNLVFFNFLQFPISGKYEWGQIEIISYSNLQNARVPKKLLALTLEQLGVEVEELDI
jgi:hypothetical protein